MIEKMSGQGSSPPVGMLFSLQDARNNIPGETWPMAVSPPRDVFLAAAEDCLLETIPLVKVGRPSPPLQEEESLTWRESLWLVAKRNR